MRFTSCCGGFILIGRQARDNTIAADLLAGRTTAGVIADKADDNNDLRELIGNRAIERFFNKLKHFRQIATRYGRRAIHFLAALHLASATWMR